MSTRAIITVKGVDKTSRLYCHGDGYPSGVGTVLNNFLKVLPSLGQYGTRKVQKAVWGDWEKEKSGRYDVVSPRGRALAGMYNVAVEPDQFVPALISYLMSKGYGGIYLTDRDPVKEALEDWTDIAWHYVVNLNPRGGKPKLDVYESTVEGDKWSFKKHHRSLEELVEAERAEWRRNKEDNKKKQTAAKRKTKSPKGGPGSVRGIRG